MARIDDGQLPAAVEELVAPMADQLGAELLEVEVKGQKGRRLVRIIADHPDGLDVDHIATLSREVGDALESRDLIAGSYTLEVTSPGADRPLRRGRDFERNVGREVRVVRTADAKGPRELTGEVVAATDDDVTLTIEQAEIILPLAEVDHGKVVLPW